VRIYLENRLCSFQYRDVPEQRGGAGSSTHQTAGSTDAWVQAIRHSDYNDKWHRTCRKFGNRNSRSGPSRFERSAKSSIALLSQAVQRALYCPSGPSLLVMSKVCPDASATASPAFIVHCPSIQRSVLLPVSIRTSMGLSACIR
jgi:hypothetical protein